jgi:osmotically-inducible protein OsmY
MTCGPLYASEPDDRIESSARNSHMFKTYLTGDDIRVQARDGVVTLRGTVTHEFHLALAQDTVAGLHGVTRVDNRLGLSTGRMVAYSDAWLSARVKTTLLFRRTVRARHIEVTAIDGVVVLRGEAPSQAQRDLITEYIDDVVGVEGIRNKMTVARTSSTTTPGDAAGETIDDASVTAQVKNALMFHRSAGSRTIQVKTTRGVVTLWGTARNAAHQALVAKLVTDIDGVKSVVNDITVDTALSRND